MDVNAADSIIIEESVLYLCLRYNYSTSMTTRMRNSKHRLCFSRMFLYLGQTKSGRFKHAEQLSGRSGTRSRADWKLGPVPSLTQTGAANLVPGQKFKSVLPPRPCFIGRDFLHSSSSSFVFASSLPCPDWLFHSHGLPTLPKSPSPIGRRPFIF